jgi:hypothetical protein
VLIITLINILRKRNEERRRIREMLGYFDLWGFEDVFRKQVREAVKKKMRYVILKTPDGKKEIEVTLSYKSPFARFTVKYQDTVGYESGLYFNLIRRLFIDVCRVAYPTRTRKEGNDLIIEGELLLKEEYR